jgi:hypothetical protein
VGFDGNAELILCSTVGLWPCVGTERIECKLLSDLFRVILEIKRTYKYKVNFSHQYVFHLAISSDGLLILKEDMYKCFINSTCFSGRN